tara:strand:+ start:3608 stop:4195 length:588 start_codon:yes stop_codon:yes gene_type:complete
MKTSESIAELAKALCKAQSQMGGAAKTANNPFFKSKYADLSSVVQAIKEPFADNGLSYVQFPISTNSAIGVVTRLMHQSGEYLEQEYYLPLQKLDPQAAGAAITYARRYALQSIAGIPAEDDDGESAMLRGKPKTITPPQMESLYDALEESDSDIEKFLKTFKKDSVESFTEPEYIRALQMIEMKMDKGNDDAGI